jgi:hypothetical protein
MTALRLPDNVPQRLSRFSVVGTYLTDAGAHFVQHVAILREDTNLNYAKPNVYVWLMGPPLAAGARSVAAASEEPVCTVHLAAFLELDVHEMEGIETWRYEVDQENRPSNPFHQYIVHPAVEWVTAENGTRLYRKFSCAGFVLDCYRSIDIALIDWKDADNLPEVDLELVAHAYGNEVRRDRLRQRLGLSGNGPWKIVLAGYVMHAFNRSDDDTRRSPHVPATVAEKDFPLV